MPYLPKYDNTESRRMALRFAREKGATDEDFQKVIERLSEQKNQL